MSFYGNVTYYLSNAFKSMTLRNNSKTGILEPSQVKDEYELIPKKKDDAITLQTGNKWVLFGGTSTDESNRVITLFHRLSYINGSTSNEVLGAQELNVNVYPNTSGSSPRTINADTKKVQASFGDYITIPQVKFDEAGHLINCDTIKVILPTNPQEQNLNSVKNRLAQLEANVDGSQGENGGTAPNVPQKTYAARISGLESITENWVRRTPGSTSSYNEPKGIGDTLHEVMEMMGLREDTSSGWKVISEEAAAQDSSHMIGKVNLALNYTNSVKDNFNTACGALRDLLDYLVSSGALSQTDANSLKPSFPYHSNG